MNDPRQALPTPLALDLNHEGEPGEAWGNLGLWEPGDDYGSAARRLALRIGRRAGLAPGQALLDLGMGTGQQWSLWQGHFEVASIVGLDPDARHCAWARRWRRSDDRIVCAHAEQVRDHVQRTRFDAAVSVDAAYHFRSRCRLLEDLARLLKPEGRAAWSDLVLTGGASRPGPLLAAALPGAGIAAENLTSPERYVERLRGAGWRDVTLERLDGAVLEGFAHWWSPYRRRQRVRPRMWLRAEITARVLRANSHRRRLGYAIVSARPPLPPGS
ncbi:MAG: class I SAM-dependent methyltransferase [Pseudomonadales bacterium]|jgi:SAM-dependent methyltransferase|nr:class I SAM-dependent methyltransferase [Pseudomonadales bacterium]